MNAIFKLLKRHVNRKEYRSTERMYYIRLPVSSIEIRCAHHNDIVWKHNSEIIGERNITNIYILIEQSSNVIIVEYIIPKVRSILQILFF